jgi:hypothetical protein
MLVDLRPRVLAFLREKNRKIGIPGKVLGVFPARLNRPGNQTQKAYLAGSVSV